MHNPGQERRAQPRYSYPHAVTYVGVVGGADHLSNNEVPLSGWIVNLSNGGAEIETEGAAHLEPGLGVETRIPLPEVPITIPVMARVQWVTDRDDGKGQVVGLRFQW